MMRGVACITILAIWVLAASSPSPANGAWADAQEQELPYLLRTTASQTLLDEGRVHLFAFRFTAAEPDLVKLAALGYFVTFYWLWSAMWIVQHKITLLADVPTAAPEWVIREYSAADALWMLPAWGGLGPSIVLFGGVAWLLLRSARLLPRITAVLFALLAVSQLANLIYIGLRGFHGGGMFLWANDAVSTAARILAFVMAGAALYTERGLFARQGSRTRVR